MKITFFTVIGLVTALFGNSAFAFHKGHCESADGNVIVDYLSDASFGDLINATLKYNGVEVSFNGVEAPDDSKTNGGGFAKNKIAVLPFKTGENVIISPTGPIKIVVYDKDGSFVAALDCLR